MTKHEADATARQLKAAGFTNVARRENGRGDWVVDGTEPTSGHSITIANAKWFAEWAAENLNATTPQPGARLKYDEPTAQVSITVPVSVLAAADAGGRGQRSAWFVQAARAWMAREGAG